MCSFLQEEEKVRSYHVVTCLLVVKTFMLYDKIVRKGTKPYYSGVPNCTSALERMCLIMTPPIRVHKEKVRSEKLTHQGSTSPPPH